MANIRNIDYGGFDHATGSAATGSGFMIWSGSMQLSKSLAYASQKTQYYGVGIEAIADSGSYLRFQTDTDGNKTSKLDIKTQQFFLGSDTCFISGSGNGTIQISSSNFELTPLGLVKASNFSERLVVINAANSTSYYQSNESPGRVRLVLDGSLGGMVTMNVQLNSAPWNTASLATRPINDILLPFTETTDSTISEARIIIAVAGVQFDDDDISAAIDQMPK